MKAPRMNHIYTIFALPALPTPEKLKVELAIGTSATTKQSAQDRYVADIAIVIVVQTVTPH